MADACAQRHLRTQSSLATTPARPIVKNKLFAFFSEEFVRVRSNSNQTEEILDPSFISLLPANIQNYFSKFGTGGYAPSGTVTTAGQLAANTLDFPNGVFPADKRRDTRFADAARLRRGQLHRSV